MKDEIFDCIMKLTKTSIKVKVSFLEIYNEKIHMTFEMEKFINEENMCFKLNFKGFKNSHNFFSEDKQSAYKRGK